MVMRECGPSLNHSSVLGLGWGPRLPDTSTGSLRLSLELARPWVFDFCPSSWVKAVWTEFIGPVRPCIRRKGTQQSSQEPQGQSSTRAPPQRPSGLLGEGCRALQHHLSTVGPRGGRAQACGFLHTQGHNRLNSAPGGLFFPAASAPWLQDRALPLGRHLRADPAGQRLCRAQCPTGHRGPCHSTAQVAPGQALVHPTWSVLHLPAHLPGAGGSPQLFPDGCRGGSSVTSTALTAVIRRRPDGSVYLPTSSQTGLPP